MSEAHPRPLYSEDMLKKFDVMSKISDFGLTERE
jgi:hypothetical protein